MRLPFLTTICLTICLFSFAQNESYNNNKFRQLYQELPTPNAYRTASGAPGHAYWQQEADYVMDIILDDESQIIYGEETITYTNNSPDALGYLWLQLDQNVRAKDSNTHKVRNGKMKTKMSYIEIGRQFSDFDGGFKIEHVKDMRGKDLDYTVNQTMMRIDLKSPLASKGSISFEVKWWYNINDRLKIGGRGGYEYFPENDNYLYTIAQYYPRMCQYSDIEGWQNKQFLGSGEFALSFGNYTVNLTVPGDHVVASTGVLQNPKSVLTTEQLSRLVKAKSSDMPIMIITQQEAETAEKGKVKKSKTWSFKAKNVRDFAFASSRKFIWDAMAVEQSDNTVMAMSYYPKEGNPLWEKYSTKAVAQTIETYSDHTFDYPYPVAISVHALNIGMEYPMICFNGGRPETDGTYSPMTKHAMISVIIHEVGHNYFPMIVASDERQWTWMDEGLNTFLQYLTEKEFDRNYPSRRGEPRKIVDYMKGDKKKIAPIMTNSESLHQFGNNAYGKPATALNILRETVMGRELFDYAFKEYANRWKFKHPAPADFFRTMEDASAVDLDWFWRGWFYTNEHVDISIDDVTWYQIDNGDPDKAYAFRLKKEEEADPMLNYERNKKDIPETRIEKDPSLNDFYTSDDRYVVNTVEREVYQSKLASLTDVERAWLESADQYYEVTFTNHGGLVMPLILQFDFVDGSSELINIPAEIWRKNQEVVTKIFKVNKEAAGIYLDPYQETADVNMDNNAWPTVIHPSRFELFRKKTTTWGAVDENEMQKKRKLEK